MAIQIPQPKAELFIKTTYRTDGSITGFLEIYPHSLASHVWIQGEAPQFGRLCDPDDFDGKRTLFVHPVYDVLEVKAYLESMDTTDTPQGAEE